MKIRERIAAVLLVAMCALTVFAGDYEIIDGKVVFPESDISETATFYTIQGVTIFVAKNSSGDIISHQNACQACGAVGFVQVGTAMKCNGCGLKYELDNLGVDNPGACWPFYVANALSDGNVEINLTDLGLEDTPVLQTQGVTQEAQITPLSHGKVSLHIPESGLYEVSLMTIQGRNVFNSKLSIVNGEAQLALPSLAAGHYVMQVKGNALQIKKMISIF